jgi:TonB family protein
LITFKGVWETIRSEADGSRFWVIAGIVATVILLVVAYVSTHKASDFEDVQYIVNVEPEYPKAALDNNIQGDVTIRITIGSDGKILYSAIASSSGNPLLDDAGLMAARESTYRPPRAYGMPVQRTYLVVYTFRLNQ